MTKKEYMKPAMEVVKIQQQCQILAGSLDANGMNNGLLDDEVDEGWAPMYDEIGLGF
jgi:hypothetical protein